jgi:hypothetical protein
MTAVLAPDVRPSFTKALLEDAASLLATLAHASALIETAQLRGQALALDVLGDINLPDAMPATADDQALIRAVAPLYLAAQLEEAALVPAVETLSALAVSGGLPVDLGPAASLIEGFWRQRNERFHENERRAFFARLFGADHPDALDAGQSGRQALNTAFEELMINLCESLYKLDEQTLGGKYASPHAQVRVLTAARNLAENLLNKGGGMTAFAAKEILDVIQTAVQILQQPGVQHAFGARSLWTAVRAVASRYLHINPDTSSYVTRGKSGLILLSWLADSLPHLNDNQPLVTLDHPVIGAATEWLQASLTIREAGSQAGG